MKQFKKLFLLSAALLLSACGSKVDGTYEDKAKMISYTFSNGKMTKSQNGKVELEVAYEIDGNNVKIITPQGSLVMTLLEDGSIQGPMGIKLTKQKK